MVSSSHLSTDPHRPPHQEQTKLFSFFLLAKNKPSPVEASPHNTIFSKKLKLTPTFLFLSSLIGD
jgi:hypothetical protein